MRFLFILIVLFSCSNNNSIHESNMEFHESNMQLLDEIIIVHDELMMEMKNLKNLKNDLIEIEEKIDVDEKIKNLEDAHKSMMNFMENFSAEFSFEDYPMNKEKYKNLNQSDLKNVNQKLKEFDKAINKVSDKFQNGVRKGKEYFASDDKRDYNKNKTSHVLTKKDKNKKGK